MLLHMGAVTGRKTFRQQRAEASRTRVLDAAECEFGERTFDAARIHAIADRADVAIGTIYGSFEGKLELYEAVQSRRLEELFAKVSSAMAEADRAYGALELGNREMVRFFCERPFYLAMHLHDGQAWSTTMRLRTEVQQRAHEDGVAMMRDLIAQAGAEGDIVSEDADLEARLVIAMQQVMLARWLAAPSKESADDLSEATWRRIARTWTRNGTGGGR